MLKKLLRYDLENIFKFLIIFYSLAIFFAILTRILFSIDNSFIINIIAKITSGATIAMVVNILINNLMRLWVRFKSNFYGDESYLTHTLPVDKKMLYLSKVLTSVISCLVSIIVIGLTLFIAYYSKENLEILKNMLLPLADIYDSSIIKILISFLFVFFLELANILQVGFTGIILGHKMYSNKTLYSVIYGFVCYIITQTFSLLILFLVALFNQDLMNLFITNSMINIDMVKLVLYLSCIIYIITILVIYVINLKLFKKGVNVD